MEDQMHKTTAVLLLDDDRMMGPFVEECLEEAAPHAYRTTHTVSSREALEAAADEGAEILLLDYHLGDDTGFHALEQLRDAGYDGPVIMLTGAESAELDRQALDLGISDYLTKAELAPLSLERTIRYALAQHRLRRLLAGQASQLRTIVDSLRIGAAIVDDVEGGLSYLSSPARQMLGEPDSGAAEWWRSLDLSAADAERLHQVARQPARDRSRVQVDAGRRGGSSHVGIEVVDHPEEERGRLLFLYDGSEVANLRRLLDEAPIFHHIVARSAVMTEVFSDIEAVADFESTVLIRGETGTGKELVARAIHDCSRRADGPFVAVNCAGLSDTLLVSQLFGHRKGAFTGATESRKGYFEAAHRGTLFLDEIGDIPHGVQVSLLRVLQEREITRVGEVHPTPVDVRVIAATHQDLAELVAEGRFRADLLYRIRVARVDLPPLRDRREDIPPLTARFLEELASEIGSEGAVITDGAMEAMMGHDWPGNVRELKAAVEAAFIKSRRQPIEAHHLPEEIIGSDQVRGGNEKERIISALARAGTRIEAARMLGMSRATLYRKMSVHGIDQD
jgi:DNA-binding NtrC family response regulator